jgi:hypothetical protein
MTAALILATAQLCADKISRPKVFPSEHTQHCISKISFDLRYRLSPEAQRFNVICCNIERSYAALSLMFWVTAALFGDFYIGIGNDIGLLPLVRSIGTAISRVAEQNSKPAPPLADTAMNNLRVIERKLKRNYGSIEIGDFWLAIDNLWPFVLIYTFTWKDQMQLRAVYNEAFHTKETIERLLLTALDILFKKLKIEN